jgi:thioredoxin 1
MPRETGQNGRMNEIYASTEPARADVDRLAGPTLIEFGSPTCGHCQRAQPLLAAAIAAHPGLRHVKIADGPGRPLGRSFRVKLWPTLIFMRDGEEVLRLVRPATAHAIGDALAEIDPAR